MKNIRMRLIATLCSVSLSMGMASAYERPTMGWSSWNAYGFRINEDIIKTQADAIVDKGLKAAGYVYLNIDDGFFGGRDKEGRLLIHPTRFPNGMKTVVDYIHGKGLKAGIYSDAGRNTCASYWGGDTIGVGVGMYGHDQEDADLYFKELGFDFIKVDFCGGDPGHNVDRLDLDEERRYTDIHRAIVNTGRKDVRLNVCRWAFPGTWVLDVATSWRISEDIYLGWNSIKSIVGQNLYLSAYATEGRYNDMDMLEVGRGLSAEEDKTHFGMWCIMSSPLLIGCDMTTIADETLRLMTNDELIALNQDSLGLQAYVVEKSQGAYLLVKDIEKRRAATRAIAIYNPTDNAVDFVVDFLALDLGGRVMVRDLFEKKDMGEYAGSVEVNIPPHGTRIYKLTAEKRLERTVYEGETAWLSAYQELYNNQSAETAIYEEADYCSGGAKAGWLGKGVENDLQWRDVYSNEGGAYTMTLTYITGESRDVTVEVNGENIGVLTLNSGGWSTPATREVEVDLKRGNNVIRLYNPSAWMPDIDCMRLHPKESLDIYANQLAAQQSKTELLLGKITCKGVARTVEEALKEAQKVEHRKEAYIQVTKMLQEVYDDAVAAIDTYDKIATLTLTCQENMACSVPCELTDKLAETIGNAREEADSAATAKDMEATYKVLRDAAISFHTSAMANPAEGMQWDMTFMLKNPTFDNINTGWSSSPTVRSDVAEFWNTNFTLYQTISDVKNGSYLLKVQALYRTGQNDGGVAYRAGTESIPAKMVLERSKQPIVSLYSHTYQGDTRLLGDLDMKNGYINSMYAASLCFAEGAYWNVLEGEVSDNSLRIGLTNNGSQYDSWCCFDNFKLYYCGGDPAATAITGTKQYNSTLVDVYSIDGILHKANVKRDEATQGLPKGLYIVGTQKVIVK